MEITKTAGGTLTATRYYAGIATRTAAGLTWILSDHHGSAQLAINATTLAATTRRFLPFGGPRGAGPGAWPNERGYINGVADPTGLTHLGAREYDPTTGRFISVDPLMDLTDPQQWQGYAYANNSPVTNSDPDGLKPCGDGDDCADATYADYGATQAPGSPVRSCSRGSRRAKGPA